MTTMKHYAAAGALAAILASSGPLLAEEPTSLAIAGIFSSGVENAWERSIVDSFNNVIAEKPHGLDIELRYTENVWGDQAEAAMRAYADTGQYDIIYANSSYSDQVEHLKDQYPDIMWVVTGSGNRGLGGNAYWVFMHAHEPAYLMGMIAGRMTKSNVLGVVGLYPGEDVNDQINAFFDGARSVNPDIERKVSFIESWYDPAKSEAATTAHVAAGADQIFQVGNAFETCKAKGIMCYGNYIDVNAMAPDAVVTSAVAKWEPAFRWLIDQWYAHEAKGVPYDAPTEPVWFGMAEGGAALAPFHAFEAKLPAEVKAEVEKAKADIMSGELKVELDVEMPVSD